MKNQKSTPERDCKGFDLLSEEVIFAILDFLNENPLDMKSFSLACKSLHFYESRHKKLMKPLRTELLSKVLSRYPNVSNVDLSMCPWITDISLAVIAAGCGKMLRSINLSRSKFFTHAGLSNLVTNCGNLTEIDLSNATELKDLVAAVIA